MNACLMDSWAFTYGRETEEIKKKRVQIASILGAGRGGRNVGSDGTEVKLAIAGSFA